MKDASQQAEKAVNDHRLYDQSVEDNETWMAETDRVVEDNSTIPMSKEELQQQVHTVQVKGSVTNKLCKLFADFKPAIAYTTLCKFDGILLN